MFTIYRNQKENIASLGMVKALIEKYYSLIDDEKPSPVVKEILERNIPKDELKKAIPSPEQLLAEMLEDFEEYEDNLQELADLSCILDDSAVRFHDKKAYEKYVNYLISNSPDLLLKAVNLLHWFYDERKYGTPVPKKIKK